MVENIQRVAPGTGTFFSTVRLREPGTDFLTRHVELLRLSVRLCQFRHPFTIDDAVVLPDRIHTIWTLPPGDDDVAVRWRSIKASFAQHLPAAPGAPRRRTSVWQRGHWGHPVETLADLAECRAMIRSAPVRAGLVDDPRDWPYATANRAARGAGRPSNVVPLRVVR